MPLAVELELDAFVDDPLAVHPFADTRPSQQFDRALLEHAGPDPVLDVVAAAVLEHDGIDALEVEQVREGQAGGAGADDPDLGPHQPSSSTRWATANAALAAGTPQ